MNCNFAALQLIVLSIFHEGVSLEYTYQPLIAGIVGTLVMTFFLRRARFLHLPETQMVRAIGAMITRDEKKGFIPGVFVHLIAGVIFAYGYAFLLSTLPHQAGSDPASAGALLALTAMCGLMGLVHGLIVTLGLVIAVAQYHPVEKYRQLTPEDTASHVIAHVFYGITVGLLLSYLPHL